MTAGGGGRDLTRYHAAIDAVNQAGYAAEVALGVATDDRKSWSTPPGETYYDALAIRAIGLYGYTIDVAQAAADECWGRMEGWTIQ